MLSVRSRILLPCSRACHQPYYPASRISNKTPSAKSGCLTTLHHLGIIHFNPCNPILSPKLLKKTPNPITLNYL